MRQVQISGLGNIIPPYTIEACDAFLENCQLLYGGSGSIPPTLDLLVPDKFNSVPITTVKIVDNKGCITFKILECATTPEPTPTPTPTPTTVLTPTPSVTPTFTPTPTPSTSTPALLPSCGPLYSLDDEQVYYFDLNTYTTTSYYNFGYVISAMTMDTNYLWVYSWNNNEIKEYDITTPTPTLIRTIDTATNAIKIYGMFKYGTNQLITTDDTNQVNIINISGLIATSTTLFTHGGSNQPYCNVYRDSVTPLNFIKTGPTNLEVFQDDGTSYATASIAGNLRGIFYKPSDSRLYAINSIGDVFYLPVAPGVISPIYTSTISPNNTVNVGVAQSNTCV